MRFEHMSDQALWAVATPIMDNLMDASTHLNHERHVRDCTERLRKILTPEYFECVCKQYQADKGVFAQRIPVAVFRRPDSVAFIWKQYFTGASGEFVAEMVLVQKEERNLVDHVMVF